MYRSYLRETLVPARICFLLGISIFAVVACGGPTQSQRLTAQGRTAEERQDWMAAANAYDEACQVDPQNLPACQRGEQMRNYAAQRYSYDATLECNAGRIEDCLRTIAPVRTIRSAYQAQVETVVALAADKVMARCNKSGGDIRDLIAEVGCLQPFQVPLWSHDPFRQVFSDSSYAASRSMLSLLGNTTPVGEQVLYLDAAQCLAPLDQAHQDLLRSTNSKLVAEARIPLRISYTASGVTRRAPGSCQKLAAEIGSGLFCGDRGPNPPIKVQAAVYSVQPRWQKTVSEELKSVRYLAGEQEVRNPDYEQARLEYRLAEKRFSEIQRITEEREYQCNESGKKYDCDRYNSTVALYNQRQEDLSRTRERANQETPTTREKVYRSHQYTRRTHRWTASYQASIGVGAQEASPEIFSVVYTDTEQPEFSPAGIAGDSLTSPPANYFRDTGSRWLLSRIKDRVEREVRLRAEESVANCGDKTLECRAKSFYWQGRDDLGLWFVNQIQRQDAKLEIQCTASVL